MEVYTKSVSTIYKRDLVKHIFFEKELISTINVQDDKITFSNNANFITNNKKTIKHNGSTYNLNLFVSVCNNEIENIYKEHKLLLLKEYYSQIKIKEVIYNDNLQIDYTKIKSKPNFMGRIIDFFIKKFGYKK